MAFKSIIGAICTCLAVVSFNADAVVINTLNGTNYEWLELTETTGLSRNQVETEFSDSNSALFGYQYASRSLLEDLFHSYVTWDGVDGFHAESSNVLGSTSLINDFGSTSGWIGDPLNPEYLLTSDNQGVFYDNHIQFYGYYGGATECGALSCLGEITILRSGETSVAARTSSWTGWDQTATNPLTNTYELEDVRYGHFIYLELSTVPIPASIWLFGSGLLGLIGVARRKNT